MLYESLLEDTSRANCYNINLTQSSELPSSSLLNNYYITEPPYPFTVSISQQVQIYLPELGIQGASIDGGTGHESFCD